MSSIKREQKFVAKVLLFDDEGSVLVLIRNSTHPNFPNHLDFPGGEVEPGEQAPQAVVREVKEETGISITLDNLRLVHKKLIDNQLIHMLYEAHLKVSKPFIRLSWEHVGSKWMSLENLQSLPVFTNVDKYYLTVLGYLAGVQKR